MDRSREAQFSVAFFATRLLRVQSLVSLDGGVAPLTTSSISKVQKLWIAQFRGGKLAWGLFLFFSNELFGSADLSHFYETWLKCPDIIKTKGVRLLPSSTCFSCNVPLAVRKFPIVQFHEGFSKQPLQISKKRYKLAFVSSSSRS